MTLNLLLGDMVADLKVADKNEDALSIADSGIGTSSVSTAGAGLVRGRHSYTLVDKRKCAVVQAWKQIYAANVLVRTYSCLCHKHTLTLECGLIAYNNNLPLTCRGACA